jgi:hypothetical protein
MTCAAEPIADRAMSLIAYYSLVLPYEDGHRIEQFRS